MSGEGFGDNLVENIDQNLTENDKQLGEEEIWGDQTIGATLSALVTSGQQATSIPIFTNSSAESTNIKEAATKDQIASSLNQLLAMQSGNPRKISETHRSRSRSNERKHISSSIANSAALAAAAQQSGTNPPVVIIPITTVIPPTKGLEESADDDKQDDEKSQSKQYLRMRGLPFNARERELFEFLGFSLESDQLSFRHDSQGRFCGECVIKSSDQKQFDRIMQMHMRNMGKRYIEVFPADQNDFLRSQESQFIDDDDDKNNADGSSYDPEFLWSIGIVKIRGLPYDSNDMDIQQFFKDSQIIPNGIQKVFDGRRPSGEAFILFSTRADATKALEKDKQRMGSRYIEVFLCHPKEYTNHIKRRKEIQEGGGGYGGGGYGGNVGGYGGRYERGGGYGGYGGYNGYGGGYQHSYQQGSSQYGGGGGNGGYPRGNDSRYGGGSGGSNSSSGYASRYGSSPPRGGAAIGPASGAPGGYYKKGPASTMGGNSTNGYYDRGQNGGYNRMQGGNGGGMNSGRYQNDSRQPSNNYKKDDYNRSYGDYDQRQQQQQQQPQQLQSSSSSYNAPAPMVNSNTYGSTQYQDPTTSVPSGNVGQQQPYYYGSQQTSTQQQQYTYPTSNYTSGTTTGYGTTSSTSNSITDPSAAVQAQGYSYAAQTATTQPNYHSQYSSYYPAQQAQQPDSSAGYYAQQPQTSAATTQASSYYTQSSVKTGGYSYQHQ